LQNFLITPRTIYTSRASGTQNSDNTTHTPAEISSKQLYRQVQYLLWYTRNLQHLDEKYAC